MHKAENRSPRNEQNSREQCEGKDKEVRFGLQQTCPPKGKKIVKQKVGNPEQHFTVMKGGREVEGNSHSVKPEKMAFKESKTNTLMFY